MAVEKQQYDLIMLLFLFPYIFRIYERDRKNLKYLELN